MNVVHVLRRYNEHFGAKDTLKTFGHYFDFTSKESLVFCIEQMLEADVSVDTHPDTNHQIKDQTDD